MSDGRERHGGAQRPRPTVFQVAPVYAASADMSSGSMNGMMHEQHGQGDKMPCKGMLPNCMTDIGCIFLVSVFAARPFILGTSIGWALAKFKRASDPFAALDWL